MKNLKFNLFWMTLSLILIIRCTKSDTNDSNLTQKTDYTQTNLEGTFEQFKSLSKQKGNESLFEYARLLSIAINQNKKLNEILETKALKLIKNGYYEQEFYTGMEGEINESSLEGKSLNNILINVGPEGTQAYLKSLEISNPDMSVLLLGDSKIKKTFANKVFVDNGFDDLNPNETIYYFENGKLSSQNIGFQPSEKAFIDRTSEVSERNSKLKSSNPIELFRNNSGVSVKLNPRSFNSSNATAMELRNNDCHLSDPNIECERDCINLTENLWRFRTVNTYDPWRGNGEWYFLIIWANNVVYNLVNGSLVVTGNPLGYLHTGEFPNVKDNDQWYYPDISTIYWNKSNDGDRMKVVLYEGDGGSVQNLNVTLNFNISRKIGDTTYTGGGTVSTIFTINDGDDFIGEYIVEYCHGIGFNGFEYHPAPGQVDVQHNER